MTLAFKNDNTKQNCILVLIMLFYFQNLCFTNNNNTNHEGKKILLH